MKIANDDLKKVRLITKKSVSDINIEDIAFLKKNRLNSEASSLLYKYHQYIAKEREKNKRDYKNANHSNKYYLNRINNVCTKYGCDKKTSMTYCTEHRKKK